MSEPSLIISEKIILSNRSVEDVYEKCIGWIKRQKAKILRQERPFYIKARNNKGIDIHIKNTAKDIEISLNVIDNNIDIELKIWRIKMFYYKWTILGSKKRFQRYKQSTNNLYKIVWMEMLEDFYIYLDLMIDESFKKKLYPKENLDKILKYESSYFVIFSPILVYFIYLFLNIQTSGVDIVYKMILILICLLSFYLFSYGSLLRIIDIIRRKHAIYNEFF